LASSPTTRKKNVIRPSFTHCRRSCEIPEPPTWIESFVVQTDSYELDQGEFAHKSAAAVAPSKTTALPVSVQRKSRTGDARFRAHAVRPVNGSVLPAEVFMRDTVGPVDPNHARDLLARERRRVEESLARLRHEPDEELSHLDQHPADEATELFEEERDEGIAERVQDELAAIERAEKRLEQGTYGTSVESGEPIPEARLEAIPWAERTEQEQERYESR
jgi:DnaK suppressor protein